MGEHDKRGRATRRHTHADARRNTCMIATARGRKKKDGFISFIDARSGLKCLPLSKVDRQGQLVHDCHAEVLARRGFLW